MSLELSKKDRRFFRKNIDILKMSIEVSNFMIEHVLFHTDAEMKLLIAYSCELESLLEDIEDGD